MRNTFRSDDGYTLVELLITILTGTIVMLAAVSILLLGVRINRQSMGTASRQTTTRILMSSLEDLAAEGSIAKVTSDLDSWKVCADEAGTDVLYTYNSEKQTISSGSTVILEGVIASDIALEGKLLTVTVTTEDGTYTSSVYCRLYEVDGSGLSSDTEVENIIKPGQPGIGDVVQSEDAASLKFLKKLVSQYTMTSGSLKLRNPGLILENGVSTGEYYSEWYIGSYADNPGWNAGTPWCACFISWGLDEVWKDYSVEDDAPRFANVDAFMNYLKDGTDGHLWRDSAYYGNKAEPKAGDLIFFDWKVNSIRNPEHIGAVIDVDRENGYVYTIEGNSSNRVMVRKYKLENPRIIGYGIVNWPDERT